MTATLKTITPVDGSVYVERPYFSDADVENVLAKAFAAQKTWAATPIAERAALCLKAVDAFVAQKADIAEEITWQIGRPISQSPGEVGGFEERARYMIGAAEHALADVQVGEKEGFTRFIRRQPLGTAFTIAPWNFPFMTAVNSIVPALMAGNTSILKHAAQTPLCAERLSKVFAEAGLPEGVFQHVLVTHDQSAKMIKDPRVNFISFTGSVPGGAAIEEAAVGAFKAVGLELGGKDPAYVRHDANIAHAVDTAMDGAFFNSGQSCCGIERIYVHENVYDDFVEQAIKWVSALKLGNPTEKDVTMGPVAKASAATFIRGQIDEAVKAGAKALIDRNQFPADEDGTPYLMPQILVNVDHSMRFMTEETFGPAVGIMKVKDDAEAVALMNDSEFGLTAAIFTQDQEAALNIGDQIETGTFYMNRCDYLDPALAWTGVKNSGRGCTLSRVGYEHLTRPKSFHLKTAI